MNRFIADGETGLRQGDVYHINHTCVPVTCQRPNDVANGVIHSNRSVFYFGETIDFSCSLGWKLNGTSSLTCAADRNWNSSQPVCEAISCPKFVKTGKDVQKVEYRE
ncbi:beta-2-glycoprotein 1-like [Gigantopelta aegis]|uniref:beta-2-glycoprotein 1-like n=1 Tax=Gigantopelta aegis TaxID=1735272 RepID=UPI001B888E4F|nr:beta-2-glycoprotein 1-like [Gigantopelta aegis]